MAFGPLGIKIKWIVQIKFVVRLFLSICLVT
jgi:hypothetical protein